MRRVLGGLREWPVSARAAAGVLSALVVVFALTTVLSARHHDRTRLRTASPSTSTTATTSPSDTAFLTTVPAPTTSTSAAKGAEASTTTTAPAFHGPVIATTAPAAPPRTTSTTATTAPPSEAYCRAAVTDPRPAAGAQETVNITSTLPGHEVTLVVHYRTGDLTFPAKGQPPFTTDASGKITVNFDVSQGSKDYPVIVDVTFSGSAATCETNFRPAT